MAVQAIHALLCVFAHLVFMDHGVLGSGVAFRALSRGPHEISARLLRFYFWPRPIDEKSGEYKREGNRHRNKDMSKRRSSLPPAMWELPGCDGSFRESKPSCRSAVRRR